MHGNIPLLASMRRFFMKQLSFRDFIEGVKNDVKIAVDDIFAIIEKLYDEIQEIKGKNKE
jgi:hypothetical protein